MKSNPYFKLLTQILVALVLIVSSILMLIPATRDTILSSLGILEAKPPYNGFEPFVPFVPGYFPDDFEITMAENYQSASEELSLYSELYASDTIFIKIIQQQGWGVPGFMPDARFIIQEVPASLTRTDPNEWLREKEKSSLHLELTEGWVVSLELKGIYIQVITNLPQEEALLVAEGLVPAICTTQPTATPENKN
ncbi:MAG: hypothetical protein JW757_07730 [Anaerolineales bacterium]|nr:hypothetical protein [Anaerolineales bacterium]